jgi:LCP family protein required for cell wall assembly
MSGVSLRRRSWPARGLNVVAALLSAVVLLASVGGYAVVTWFNDSISRVHLDPGPNRPAEASRGSVNWLLVGTDSGAGTNDEYGERKGQRSDTTILVHLDADGTTTNISFPRDTLVTIPEYVNGAKKQMPAHKEKFNAAIELGGPSLLLRTVELMTHVRIDHYVSVDLNGFKKISQAIDGVDVCILQNDKVEDTQEKDVKTGLIIYHHDTNIDDSYSGFHGKVGPQRVVGEQALAFVRQRHGIPGGDIGRIQRQQQFLGAVFRAATASRVLFNPVRVTRLLAAFKGALTLDGDTSFTDLENLGLRLKGVAASRVSFETVPQRGLEFSDTDLGTVFPDADAPTVPDIIPNGQALNVGNVQILKQAEFEAMLEQIGGGYGILQAPGAVKSAEPTIGRAVIAPSNVLVTVQDGIGRSGLAAEVTRQLTRQTFRTGAPGPADRTSYPRSEVHYAPSQKDAAQTVAAAVPGAVLRLDPRATGGVLLIVGANYSLVRPVTLGSDFTPTPAPTSPVSASPSPAAQTAASVENQCTY